MTTRMIHPLHGATHAYSADEIARLQGYGWSIEGEKQEAAAAPSAGIADGGIGGSRAVPASADSFEVPTIAKRKPGRPRKAQ